MAPGTTDPVQPRRALLRGAIMTVVGILAHRGVEAVDAVRTLMRHFG